LLTIFFEKDSFKKLLETLFYKDEIDRL
jgi:hypothetical protein